MSLINVNKVDPSTGTALEIGTSGDTITVPTGAGLTVTDEVKTNKISPATGTAFTLGDSGDTFTVPSGATIVNSGTATGFGVAGTNLFRATMSSNQTGLTSNTWIKAIFDTDIFDADSVFDTSNNRFIAPAAGKYFFNAKISIFPATANGPMYWTRFYKNGSSATKEVVSLVLGGSDNYLAEIALVNSTIIELAENDYIEFYGRFKAGSGTVTFDNTESYFIGYRVV